MWVSLIVARPRVVQPNCQVDQMVSAIDLFSLSGELAGVDIRNAVPKARALDANPLLPYLTNPSQPPIRTDSYRGTELLSQPCVLMQFPRVRPPLLVASLYEEEGRVWYGPGSTVAPQPFTSCCHVNCYRLQNGLSTYSILPTSQAAMRNAQYKYIT